MRASRYRCRVTAALLTDKYELTMLSAALRDGSAGPHDAPSRCSPAGCPTAAATAWSPAPAGCSTRLSEFVFDDAALAVAGAVPGRARRWTTCATSASRGDIDGYPEGELYFPGSPILSVTRHLRRVRGAGDAGAVDPQPRHRDRLGGGPDGQRRRRPADDRDGFAAHPRVRRGRRGARRLHRRLRRHLEPRSRAPLRHSRARHQRARVHAAAHHRETDPNEARRVPRAGRRAGRRRRRCWSTPTT